MQPETSLTKEKNEELINTMIIEEQQWKEQGYDTLILGDLNAHIQESLERTIIGRNKNGKLLMNLVEHCGLEIMNLNRKVDMDERNTKKCY